MSDLISRQAAIDKFKPWLEVRSYGWGELNMLRAVINELENLPPVQPKRMKGRWLPDNNFAYEMRFVCSVCKESEVVPTIGFTKYKPIWDFCPNCGADMRGEAE